MISLRDIVSWVKLRLFVRQGFTVRYAFPLVLVAALLGATVVNTQTESYVRVKPSQTTVEAGDHFSIGVYAYAHTPVNAINISLQFSPKQVEILGVDIGQSVITIWAKDPYVENNSVILSGGTYQKGFKGEHLIATINAKAKETGLATFSAGDIKLLAGDGSGTPVRVSEQSKQTLNIFVVDDTTDAGMIAASVGLTIVTDLDGDGKVGIKDISMFMAAWFSSDVTYDFDNDGRMTFKDFSIILAESFFN